MCVKPQMRLYVCQALPLPNTKCVHMCVTKCVCMCHQMCLYVCHQMRSNVCHQMRLAESTTELTSLANFCSLRSHVFQQSKQEFLSKEHSCLFIDSCLNTDSCVNADSCPNTNSWTLDGPQMDPKWTRNGPKMDPKWTQNGPKMDPKWTRNGPEMDPKWTRKWNHTVTHTQTHLELDTHMSEDHPLQMHRSRSVYTTPQKRCFRGAKVCSKWLQERSDDSISQSDNKFTIGL